MAPPADLAAGIAANEGHSLAGLRDAALITVGSDALLRVSEIAALTVADVQVQSDGSGTVTIHASKTDQEGRGHTRYLGAPTVAAVQRWMQASGISAGPLFVRVRRGDVAGTKPLDVRSIRSIIAKRAAAAGIPDRISGHSLRVGSAQSLAAAGAGLVELQQAGDRKAPQMPARYARHQQSDGPLKDPPPLETELRTCEPIVGPGRRGTPTTWRPRSPTGSAACGRPTTGRGLTVAASPTSSTSSLSPERQCVKPAQMPLTHGLRCRDPQSGSANRRVVSPLSSPRCPSGRHQDFTGTWRRPPAQRRRRRCSGRPCDASSSRQQASSRWCSPPWR